MKKEVKSEKNICKNALINFDNISEEEVETPTKKVPKKLKKAQKRKECCCKLI